VLLNKEADQIRLQSSLDIIMKVN